MLSLLNDHNFEKEGNGRRLLIFEPPIPPRSNLTRKWQFCLNKFEVHYVREVGAEKGEIVL